MNWTTELQSVQPIAHSMLVLCAVATLGLALGSVRVQGISLGVAGASFVGIAFGHLGWDIAPGVRAFIQESGLILFVYTIGIQVGPGLFDSLRKHGLPLNLLASAVVCLGAVLTAGLCLWWGIDLAAGAGLFAGATTNTPALGASQQALKTLGVSADRNALPGLGYAVTYPFGIIGILLAQLIVLLFCAGTAG